MDYERAVKDLKDIRATMEKTSTRASREGGWFFLVQGTVWLVGFAVTQFAPAACGPVWLALNVASVSAMTAMGVAFSRRKGAARHPGLAARIAALSVALLAFDAMLIVSFGLTEPADFSLTLAYSLGFSYVVIGLTTRRSTSLMGAFVMASLFAARMLFPGYLYLAIGVLGGGAFIATGLLTLLAQEGADD